MNAVVLPLHKKVVVPFRNDVVTLIPEAEQHGRNLVVNHGVVETRIMRNIGIDVPAPILTQYDWAGTQPFDSQRTTAALLSTAHRAYCLSSMGVGKTRAALYAFDFLRREGVAPKALVVAPLSTLTSVWEREIFECFPHLECAVVHGSKVQRLAALSREADVFVINPDGIKVVGDELIQKNFPLIIVDELATYRNVNERWKALNAVIRTNQPIVWGLTGSPTPNAPTDAFGQVKLLTPGNVPRSFGAFRQSTMLQVSPFKWVARKEANDIVTAAMKPSVRFSLDECHDLPPTTYSTRAVPLSATQKRMYEAMMRHFKVEHKGKQITAANEGAKLQKLLQISGGFAYSEDKGAYIDAKDRLKVLLELVEQSDRKVLVFASFVWLIKALAAVLETRYSVGVVAGGVSKRDRDNVFSAFRSGPDPHVIVAHAGTMAHGLNLIEANTIIWYGPTLSPEIYEQANARVRRPGQTCVTHIIHIESTPVEKTVFRRLQLKQHLQGVLLSMFEGAQDV